MTLVLDASSVLAFLHDEPGAERVWSVLSQAVVGAVNWSEVVQKALRRQVDITGMREEPGCGRSLFRRVSFSHRSR